MARGEQRKTRRSGTFGSVDKLPSGRYRAQYYGPDGLFQQTGHPKVVGSSDQSHDTALQQRLWAVSEELTGVTFPV